MAEVKNLQAERTGREKSDLDWHETYYFKNSFFYTFFFNSSNFKCDECCFKAKPV